MLWEVFWLFFYRKTTSVMGINTCLAHRALVIRSFHWGFCQGQTQKNYLKNRKANNEGFLVNVI